MLIPHSKNRVVISVIVWTLLIALLAGGGGFLAGMLLGGGNSSGSDEYVLLDEIAATLDKYALHPQEDEDRIIQAAKGMVMMGDDLYAAYYTAEEYEEYYAASNGNYVGVGIYVEQNPQTGTITVIQAYTDSPAARAGIQSGDVLVEVDGEDIADIAYEEVVSRVKGEEGTQVELTVMRGQERITVTVTRAAVDADQVTWKIARGDIGYIRIYEFSGNALTRFQQALNELSAAGCQAYIIDLRNNPGGDRDIVVPMCDMLVPKGPILHLKNRDGKSVVDYSDANYLNKPLAVLINGGSASASELMSGCIQDYEVGTLIGTTTYGKGVAQSFRRLSDGSMLKFTSEDYLTPSGRSVQDVGVTPDIELELSEDVVSELQLATAEDNQYQKAIELLREELVTGN